MGHKMKITVNMSDELNHIAVHHAELVTANTINTHPYGNNINRHTTTTSFPYLLVGVVKLGHVRDDGGVGKGVFTVQADPAVGEANQVEGFVKPDGLSVPAHQECTATAHVGVALWLKKNLKNTCSLSFC